VELDTEDLAELEAVASTSAVSGARAADMEWVVGLTPQKA
jgi:hypothetical protein